VNSELLQLLIVTNLYPLPWEPQRATFNRQQFARLRQALGQQSSVRILIPVAWPDWLKHRKQAADYNASQPNHHIVPYLYLPKLGRRFYSLSMFISLLLAWRWSKQQPVTHLLASWAYPEGVACSWLAKWLGVPYSIKVHGSDINMHCQALARRKQVVRAANQASCILSVSQALKAKLVEYGVSAEQISVIYNGVDQSRFQPAAEPPLQQRQQLIYVGNLKSDKGIFELLQAFSLLAEHHPELSLHYYGAGPGMARLKQQITQRNLQGRVTLHGSIAHAQLPQVFNQARLLVLPSYHEGVPNVLLEAMASGVPSVATQVGGIPEILNEHTGVLIDRVADVSATLDALNQALSRDWQSQLIREQAARFDWHNNAAATRQLLLGSQTEVSDGLS